MPTARSNIFFACRCLLLVLAACVLALRIFGFQISVVVPPERFAYEAANQYSFTLPRLFQVLPVVRDDLDPAGSALSLLEDGKALGPGNSLRDAIRDFGGGRYAHFDRWVMMSSSDNSDPRGNGRIYRIQATVRPYGPLAVLAFVALVAVSLSFPVSGRFHAMRQALFHPKGLGTAISIHVLCMVIAFGAAVVAVSAQFSQPPQPARGANHNVMERLAYYRRAANNYDVVFIGDSRTYCGIHPEILDPLLGIRSLNLSQFAHWLPTQYPMARDLVEALKPGTVVVWSVGHQNFFVNSPIYRIYPIDPSTALRYAAWRVPTAGLLDNVMFFSPYLKALAIRDSLHDQVQAILRRQLGASRKAPPVATIPDPATEIEVPFAAARDEALSSLARLAPQAVTEVTTDQGHATSVVGYLPGGGYYRIETDPAYFRKKQSEMGYRPIDDTAARLEALPEPDSGLLRLFDATLEIFRAAGVRLVVNELEEAPFVYRNPIIREKWRAFMRTRIQPRVEAAGFEYIRVDFDRFGDADYFDYNHLNANGVGKYVPALAAALRPHLPAAPR